MLILMTDNGQNLKNAITWRVLVQFLQNLICMNAIIRYYSKTKMDKVLVLQVILILKNQQHISWIISFS